MLRWWVPFVWSLLPASIVSLVFTIKWPPSSWTTRWTHRSTALSRTARSASALSVTLIIHWVPVPLSTLRFALRRWIILRVALVFFTFWSIRPWWSARRWFLWRISLSYTLFTRRINDFSLLWAHVWNRILWFWLVDRDWIRCLANECGRALWFLLRFRIL